MLLLSSQNLGHCAPLEAVDILNTGLLSCCMHTTFVASPTVDQVTAQQPSERDCTSELDVEKNPGVSYAKQLKLQGS